MSILLFAGISDENWVNPFFPPDTVHIYATGDIMLDRNVANFQNKNHFIYPVFNILPVLSEADFLTGNLESMISDKGHPQKKQYNFHADPKQIELLKLCGFDCVSVANNHAMDWHIPAFTDCMNRLTDADIAYVGGGMTYAKSCIPKYFLIGDCVVAILGFNDTKTCFVKANLPTAAPTWGNAHILKYAQDAVTRASENSDIVLVHVHWGIEDTVRPVKRQEKVAAALVDAGADVIIGHHPHRLQAVEFVSKHEDKFSVIFYSLGNFLFDQNDYLNNLSGIMDIAIVDYKIVGISMIPIDMKTYPRAVSPAAENYAEDIFNLMKRVSKDFGTNTEFIDGKLIFSPAE